MWTAGRIKLQTRITINSLSPCYCVDGQSKSRSLPLMYALQSIIWFLSVWQHKVFYTTLSTCFIVFAQEGNEGYAL